MKRTYVPTTLDQYINESKSITLKRGYKGQSPVVVGANAPIRNQILAYVAEGVRVGASDLKKFIAGLNETNANPNAAANMWLRRNGKFFVTESKGGKTYFKLSTLGQRLVNSFGSGQVSESEKPSLQEKKKYDFKDPKTNEPGIVDDEDEEVEESCAKNESVDPGKKAKPDLGGKLDKKLHNLLSKDQDKDEGELDGFEKEITEGKEGISKERKARIEAIIENIKARQKSALNEAEEEEEKEEETEEKEEGSDDELSFDDLDLSGEGEESEGEEKEEDDVDVDVDIDAEEGGEDDEDDEDEDEDDGEEEKVEITEFILTVDDVDSAISELEELGVDAEKVVDPDGEPAEGEEEAYKDDEISVDAEDWDKLKGWLEEKGVDVEEMFGGEIEVEDVEDEDLDMEDEEDLDVELEAGPEEDEENEEGEEDIDLDMDMDVEGAEELEMEEEEPEVEESLTGMEKHEDDTNNLIKGAKTVIIKYDR